MLKERGKWRKTGRGWKVGKTIGKMLGSGLGLEELAVTRRDWEELEVLGR